MMNVEEENMYESNLEDREDIVIELEHSGDERDLLDSYSDLNGFWNCSVK